jgi:1-acyl-sn-glycerol-3-phosphate acyltransferase
MTEIDASHSKHLPPEELLGPNGGPALGRDPFEETDGIDPFLERLEQLAGPPSPAPKPRPAPRPVREPATTDALESEVARPLRPRPRPAVPSLAEIEVPEVAGWMERLLGDDERRRISALAHLVDGETPFDRFGFSPSTTQRVFPLVYALYRIYFRVRSEGHDQLPESGAVVLAANHGGLLPFDGAMGVMDVLLHTDPPRLPRAIVDRWAGELPWVNVFFARVGQVVGTRENFSDLLDDEQVVLVFPEGMDGIRKTITSRYRVQRFRVGFVEQALRARAPIVPMAVIGSDDQAPILYDVKPLAKRLGLPVAPITPTFPWLGPLGLLPYPVSYKIVYGAPLNFHERFGPEGAEDARLVRYLANQVRREVQLLMDRNRG